MGLTPSSADRDERIPVGEDMVLHALRWDGDDRAPFVLVHGLASNARLWDGVAAELSAAGHPVLAVDQRGHGRSAKPDDGYDMATVADDLRAVIEASALDRPVVAGQSWGGNVVIELAARFPGVARAVAGIDGGAIDLAERFPDWDGCVEALRPPPLVGTPRAEVESTMRGAHPDWSESAIAGTMACFEVREDGTVAPWLTLDRHLRVLRGLWEHRPADRFPHVAEPVLLVAALRTERDRDDAVAGLTEAASAVPDLRIEALVGDHDLHAQHPVRVAELLRTLAG